MTKHQDSLIFPMSTSTESKRVFHYPTGARKKTAPTTGVIHSSKTAANEAIEQAHHWKKQQEKTVKRKKIIRKFNVISS